MRFFLLLLLSAPSLFGQILHSAQLEIIGSPGWYKAVNLQERGLVMILKEDQTRFKIVRYDHSLQKRWDQDLFLDAEAGPASLQVYGDRLALLFSETSGMYYQWIDFDLNTGEYVRKGFEVREFFQDKGITVWGKRWVMIGTNKEGLALYIYNPQEDKTEYYKAILPGHYEIQQTMISGENLRILAIAKTMGYANEKKKKGEYVKSSHLLEVQVDSSGKVISQKAVLPSGGKFPVQGYAVGDSEVYGLYQQPDGSKGLFVSTTDQTTNIPYMYSSFEELLDTEDKGKLKYLKAADYQLVPPGVGEDKYYLGGIFYTPKWDKNGASAKPDWEYSQAQILVINSDHKVEEVLRVALPQVVSPGLIPLSVNNSGVLAYVMNGKLLLRNFKIGTKPLAYALSEDKVSPFVAGYRQVLHWHGNVFLGIGTQQKTEAQHISGTQKKKRPIPYTQTRKTFYLTAISAGKAQ
jgi:hypothetical protein